MLLSLGIIISLGIMIEFIFQKIKIPSLVGMIVVGIIIGPYCLNLIDESILNISSEIRQIALVIILTRSGLNLDIKALKKVGRPAILMCFLPAIFEIIAIGISAFLILNLSMIDSLLMGCTIAAVSPAVVSPRMIKLIEEGYGEDKSIPEIILGGSSVDDILVLVLFSCFLGLSQENKIDYISIIQIPSSILLGIIVGILLGLFLVFILNKFNIHNTTVVIITLGTSFLLIGLENILKDYISYSSLLSILVFSMIILFKVPNKAKELSNEYNSLWKLFSIFLFILVGASVDYSYAVKNVGWAILILVIGLCIRCVGVCICLIKTNLNAKERIFCIISYLPKATVQASIGGIALSLGLPCGDIILTVAVLSIIITAPIGAFLIDLLSEKLLMKKEDNINNDLLEEI